MYDYGLGTKPNRRRAFEHYLTAAKAGDANSEYHVGIFYFRGVGVRRNRRLAAKCLIRSVKHSDTHAMYVLGRQYRYGEGVRKNPHLTDELVRLAYKRCYQEGIVTKERYDALVKALDDDPLLKEIRDYRNLSHQFAGVVVTLHDGATDAFIAHVLPPLDVQAPAQRAALNEQEMQMEVKEGELNMKLQSYCDHVSRYCERLFRTIDSKYKMAVIPRSHGFVVTIPHSYQGQLPDGAKQTVYVKPVGSAI